MWTRRRARTRADRVTVERRARIWDRVGRGVPPLQNGLRSSLRRLLKEESEREACSRARDARYRACSSALPQRYARILSADHADSRPRICGALLGLAYLPCGIEVP